MLRQRHPDAHFRYVDDDADCLRAIAADVRLLSLRLHYAGWGYHTEQQDSAVASMPRVRELRKSQELEEVLQMPRKDGTRFRI